MPVEACGANPFPSLTHVDAERAPAPPPEVERRAALLHERDSQMGIDLEVLSVSATAGARSTGVEAVVERFGMSFDGGRAEISGELFAVGAEVGTRNADGSQGVGLGAGVVFAGVEATLKLGDDSSVTIGASSGMGFHVSLGLRDADQDGKPALCGRVVELFTIAGCIELPF